MPHEEKDHTSRLAAPETAVIVVLLLVAAIRVATPVSALAINSTRLPQWDMAKYGVSGLRLARALQDLDLVAFLRHVNALDVWPPVFPFLEMPAFVVAGPGYASARGVVALLFVASLGVAFWSGLQSRDRFAIAAGAITAALVATSPTAQVFATIVMLEIPGTMFLLLAVGSYLRSLFSNRSRHFTSACIAATALFFCKYNYGLIWILAMTSSELLRSFGSTSPDPSAILKRLGSALRRPWGTVTAIGLVVATVIELTGPWQFTILGRMVRVSSAGPMLYVLYILTLVSCSLRPRRNLEAARRWLGSLDSRARSMVLAIAMPIGVWMLVPAHTINFVRFLVNRSAGPPIWSVESLLFYPRAFVSDYSASPVVGVVVLIFAALSLRRLRGLDDAGRVLALALLISSIAVVAHPYKHPRFLFTTAALLWLAGSREAVGIVALAASRAGAGIQRLVAAVVAGTSLIAAALIAVDVDRLQRGHRLHTVETSTAEVLVAITDEAVESRSSVLLGTWNHLSPWLVEWSCLQRGPSMELTQVPRSQSGRARRGDVLDWLAAGPPQRVMMLSAARESALRAGFYAETGWLDPVRQELARDSRFHLVSSRDFRRSGYRLQTFAPTRTSGEPVPR